MAAELSLESIKSCLLMERKNIECAEILLHFDIRGFLKEEQQKQDIDLNRILEKFEKERMEANDFTPKIINKEEAIRQLNEAPLRVEIKQQEYNKAVKDAQEAEIAYEALKNQNHVAILEAWLAETKAALVNANNDSTNSLGGSLGDHLAAVSFSFQGDCTWRSSPHVYVDPICRTKKENLKVKVNEQEQGLAQAKIDLDSKYQEKVNKETFKVQVDIELQQSITLKDKIENDLKIFKEWNLANQVAIDIQRMLVQWDSQRAEIKSEWEEKDISGGENFNVPVPEEWPEL